jgi:hypothetical protein
VASRACGRIQAARRPPVTFAGTQAGYFLSGSIGILTQSANFLPIRIAAKQDGPEHILTFMAAQYLKIRLIPVT